MRGRKPVPAEVREQQGGSTVSHRPAPPAAVVGEAIDVVAGDTLPAPEYLPVEVVDVWNEITPALVKVGLARTVDVPALEALCTHVALARAAFEQLTSGGHLNVSALVDYTEKGVPVVSPYHRIYRDSWREALKIAEHYGLTPISRTRLGIAALQQKSLAEQLKSIMGDDEAGDAPAGELVGETDEPYLDAPSCLGCGVEKGRRHLPGCERPGFSTQRLDAGTVVPR